MAEAIGVAASGIAIGTLAAQITSSIFKLKSYWDQIQNAPEDVRDLIEEVELLQHLLVDIEEDQQRNPISSLILDSTSMSKCLQQCKQGVDRLRELTDSLGTDLEASKILRKKWSSAKIVFKKDKD
ncbi:hypothetical protein MMC28_005913 [Mycoblastus sanguinarius]|nr:hypothetical protein [Mycoblastus sanguinarius]